MNPNFGWTVMAYGIMAATMASAMVTPNYLYATRTGSNDPSRSSGSRAHKRWKRGRAAGRRP